MQHLKSHKTCGPCIDCSLVSWRFAASPMQQPAAVGDYYHIARCPPSHSAVIGNGSRR